jgi:hypothetical protein
VFNMAYTHQIRILETKAKQLEREPESYTKKSSLNAIMAEITRLKKLEWDEKHEVVDMGEER